MNSSNNMFYGATPSIFEKAKMLRNNMTRHEKMLWEELRSNKVLGLRFKAQHPIDTFIADFYCHRLKMVIEVDGESHNFSEQREYDEIRAGELDKYGISVIRFTNQEIENGISSVFEKIITYAKERIEERKDGKAV